MVFAANAIHNKTDLLLKFLSNDDDEVSQAVIEFAREYLQFLKNKVTAQAYGIADSKNAEVSFFQISTGNMFLSFITTYFPQLVKFICT